MTRKEKEAVILEFYKATGQAQNTIETDLDKLLENDLESFNKILLNIAWLSIQILQTSWSR